MTSLFFSISFLLMLLNTSRLVLALIRLLIGNAKKRRKYPQLCMDLLQMLFSYGKRFSYSSSIGLRQNVLVFARRIKEEAGELDKNDPLFGRHETANEENRKRLRVVRRVSRRAASWSGCVGASIFGTDDDRYGDGRGKMLHDLIENYIL